MHAGDEQTLFASLKILKALQVQKVCGHNLANAEVLWLAILKHQCAKRMLQSKT